MVSHPPMFASQIAEEKVWEDGFKAGVSEVLHELDSASVDATTEGAPTREWVVQFSEKLSRRFS